MSKLKVLVLSYEVWRNDNSGGNVLSNLFESFDAEFAQIYCSPGIPKNNICNKYFQITDMMIAKNIILGQQIGREVNVDNSSQDSSEKEPQKNIYSFFKKYHWIIFDFIREMMWRLANPHNKKLDNFIQEFNPDIIFAPCYANLFMLRLSRHVARVSRKNVISYISDDHFTFRHWNFSPFFWLYRLFLRAALKNTFPYYSLVYTMTGEQKAELEKSLQANMKILMKGDYFKEKKVKEQINNPIRLVFAGGIYVGRWKTLAHIGEILKKINADGTKMILDIYTSTQYSQSQYNKLNDGKNIFLHKSISQLELKKVYAESDIALHVESFERSYRLLTRLSFSTKIVDCLGSGCAVMAISWAEHSGLKYLAKEDAAICITKKQEIEQKLHEILDNKQIIIDYANKAYSCGMRNHQIEEIQNKLFADFEKLKLYN